MAKIDTKLLDSYGDKYLISYLISNFETSLPERLDRLEDLCSSAQDDKKSEIKRCLHALKNSFGNVGAKGAAATCQDIEDQVDAKAPEFALQWMPYFKSEYMATLKDLVSYYENTYEARSTSI